MRYLLLLLLSFTLLIASDPQVKPEGQILLSMNDDPGLEDESELELGDESEMGLEDEDPLADSDDPLADDEPDLNDAVAEEKVHFPTITTSNLYRLATGNKKYLRRGFATGSDSENEDQAALVNAYSMKSKISYSEDVTFLFRYSITFLQEYDVKEERYTDDGELRVNEAYVKVDRGAYNYKLGALIVDNGPLDFDSPSNVLNMNNALAIESFDLKNLKQAFVGAQFSSVGENSTFTMTTSVLKPETAGTEYTRYLEEAKERDTSDTVEDYSELSDNIGLRYQHMFSSVDIGISAFYWFDKDTEISWTDTSNATVPNPNANFSDTYSERVTNLFFTGLDFDANLGGSVLKGEFYYFHNKNNYSFFSNSNNEKVFSTIQSDMFSGAISLEKVWGDLFMMAVYSHKELFDVQAGTNILDYENEESNNTLLRDLRTQKATLIARYALNAKTKLIMTYGESFPVKKVSALLGLEYEVMPKHDLGFKALYFDVEEHVSTLSKLNTKQIFIDYKYHF